MPICLGEFPSKSELAEMIIAAIREAKISEEGLEKEDVEEQLGETNMGYKKEIRKDDVIEILLAALREGNLEPVSDEALQEIEEIGRTGGYAKMKAKMERREHRWWECPSCHRIPSGDIPADHDFCPLCGHKLSEEEVEAQKERIARNTPNNQSKEKQIREWRQLHPVGTPRECMATTGISETTVYKWWNSIGD